MKEGFTRVGHKRRAIKIIDKEGEQYDNTEDLDLMREVDILRGIKHPCIAEVFEAIETDENVSIIMEYAAGGPRLKSALRPPPSARAESANFRPFYVKRADFSPPPPATKKRRKVVKIRPCGGWWVGGWFPPLFFFNLITVK